MCIFTLIFVYLDVMIWEGGKWYNRHEYHKLWSQMTGGRKTGSTV